MPYLGRTPERVWIRRKPWIRVWRDDGTYKLLPIPDEDHERLAILDGKATTTTDWRNMP